MSTIFDIYTEFINVYNKHCTMLVDSTVLRQVGISYEGHTFSSDMYNAIVENCFMQIFLAWERFLEKAFIAYLQRAVDLQGLSYTAYSTPIDDEHTYKMLKGTKNYPDWTSIDDVNYLSAVYFQTPGPFNILTASPLEFFELKTIRNRISYVSEKSMRSYNTLLSKNIMQVNIAPGDYLMTLKDSSHTYFSFYTETLKGYVEAICNK